MKVKKLMALLMALVMATPVVPAPAAAMPSNPSRTSKWMFEKSIFRTAEALGNKGFLPFSYAGLSLICRLYLQADTER